MNMRNQPFYLFYNKKTEEELSPAIYLPKKGEYDPIERQFNNVQKGIEEKVEREKITQEQIDAEPVIDTSKIDPEWMKKHGFVDLGEPTEVPE